MEKRLCPNCGEELEIKFTSSQYYKITNDGFKIIDENDLNMVEIVCPYDEGSSDHKPTDKEWIKEIIKQFHFKILSD